MGPLAGSFNRDFMHPPTILGGSAITCLTDFEPSIHFNVPSVIISIAKETNERLFLIESSHSFSYEQVEMAGSSIFEYIHSHDHKELAEQLGLSVPKPSSSFSSPSGTSDEGSSSTPNPPRSTTPVLDRGLLTLADLLPTFC